MSMEVLNRHWQELLAKENVLNTAIGTKFKGGKDTGLIAIVIRVSKKRPAVELSAEQMIPAEIEGIPTDVVELAPTTWQAGKTSISQMHPEDQKRMLGANLKSNPKALLEKPKNLKSPSGSADHTAVAQSIQNQGGCGCYDDQTEVLTKAGWKFWKDVTFIDEILCFDQGTKILKYDSPIELFVFDYDGEMVQIKGSSVDLLVTPNHNMLVYPWNESKKMISDKSKFTEADSLGWYFNIPCAGKWIGADADLFHLNGQPIGPYYGSNGEAGFGFRDGMDIPMDKWMDFLGIYIAEGCSCPQFHYLVQVAGKTPEKRQRVEELVSAVPFNHNSNRDDRFEIYNKVLCQELMPLGQATVKYIPDYVKQLPASKIMRFLNSFGIGDGQWTENETWRFSTSSKRLADDLQELIIKAGVWAQIGSRPGRDSVINGRTVHGGTEYSLYMSPRQHLSIDRKEMISRIPYKGKVYCAEVPTHAMVVRRNGKPLISGNSCLAFDVIGVWEGKIAISLGSASVVIKLSEAHPFFCAAGASCENGTDMEELIVPCMNGVALEQDYPYKDVDQACGSGLVSSDWYLRAKRLAGMNSISDPTQILVLLDMEPLVATMQVHQTFFNYTGGIYKSQGDQDPVVGGHGVGEWGYNTVPVQFRIMRNQWGLGWGQNCVINGVARPGWFMIDPPELDPVRYQLLLSNQPVPPPGPTPPTPSPCKWGNGIAKVVNVFPAALGRKGRFFYMNPSCKK